jgi:heme/copper-type cytochrome/quinol oxidase subunit 4
MLHNLYFFLHKVTCISYCLFWIVTVYIKVHQNFIVQPRGLRVKYSRWSSVMLQSHKGDDLIRTVDSLQGGTLARMRISLIFRLICVLTLTPIQWVLASFWPRSVTVWWLALLLHVQGLVGLNDCVKMSDHGWRIVIACHNPSRQYLKTSYGCVFPDSFNLLPFDFIHYITHVVFKTTVVSEPCKLTLILPRSPSGTVWFYTSTSNKRSARPKLYTKSLTRDLKRMYRVASHWWEFPLLFTHRASSI